MNLILCNGFNYYNRIIKRYTTYTDYYQFMEETSYPLTNINFNPTDGVNTTQIVNWDFSDPDYVVCVDENNQIHSRWFVIDATRTRAGQLRLTLHRDLIADFYSQIIVAPMYIEKATIKNTTDIAIYNSEDITFNQIKKSELLLKDISNVSWVVGYVASDIDQDKQINFTKNGTNYTVALEKESNILSDAPYKMFCIPVGKIGIMYGTIADTQTLVMNFSLEDIANLASRIAEELGSNCYDIQLLPYCPLQDRLSHGGTGIDYDWLDLRGLDGITDYNFILTQGVLPPDYKGVVIWPKKSTFTFDIEKSLTLPNTIVGLKKELQCNMYRLCCPNYSSMFEFNLVKTGSLTGFNVDCTYKPYNPYIHINPKWSNTSLYGGDYNDARGLIFQGDFSLPIVNDQWIQYQINQKNYQNSFERQVETIELQNTTQLISDIISGSTSAVSTGISVGAMTGNIWAGLGAGAASAAAGAVDVVTNAMLRNDALDLTQDQFNYSLDNIQAMPNTISKISAFDANNKIYPFLEYYTCTDEEKTIFENKLTYNGMKILRIDKIENFIVSGTANYIKGQMIRTTGIKCSTVVLNAIADELYKGVYL